MVSVQNEVHTERVLVSKRINIGCKNQSIMREFKLGHAKVSL